MPSDSMTSPTRALPREFLLARSAMPKGATAPELLATLRAAGFRIGEALYVRFCDWLALRGDAAPEQLPDGVLVEVLTEFFEVGGWGRIQLQPVSATVLALDAADWCEARDGTRDCVVSAGIFSGFWGAFVGQPIAVLEVECSASGHEHCRFLLGSEKDLRHVHATMLRGAPYAAGLPGA